jgi:hypothetical protein
MKYGVERNPENVQKLFSWRTELETVFWLTELETASWLTAL